MNLYHSSKKENLNKILEEGLKINSGNGFTLAGNWSTDVYGMKPIYLSLNPYHFWDEDMVLFKVDVDLKEYKILPDLPILVDHGAYVEENGLYWEEGSEPPELLSFLDENGFVSFEDLLQNKSLIKQLIKITKTLVVVNNIPPNKIKLMEQNNLKEYIQQLVVKEFNAISTGGGAMVSSGQMTGTSSASAWGKKPVKKRDSQKEFVQTEAAKDIGSDMKVNVKKTDKSFKIVLFLKNQIIGEIEFFKFHKCEPYVIVYSEAIKGYGPILYDLALELAGEKGIVSDRRKVSNSAANIWKYYFHKRNDVIKKPIEELSCSSKHETSIEELNYVYYKLEKTILNKLRKNNQIQESIDEYNEDLNMLTEKMVTQLEPNMKVVVHKESPGIVIIVVQDHEGDEFGEIQIARSEEDGCVGAWEVIMASAHKGYGPFLYDIAMELVGSSGLMSDRQTTSNDARAVWRYYYNNRKDVMKKPVEYDCEATQKTPMNELNYIYYKKNKNITDQLKKNNQLVFKK